MSALGYEQGLGHAGVRKSRGKCGVKSVPGWVLQNSAEGAGCWKRNRRTSIMAGLRFLPGKTLTATLVIWAVSIAHMMAADTDVVINEIMYHPPLDMDELQYVELFNRGTAPVDLSKWTFARGIKCAFPDKIVIAPGGFHRSLPPIGCLYRQCRESARGRKFHRKNKSSR